MNLLNEIVQSELFQILLKLLLSSFLAGVIGIERSSLSKPAGFGTYSIIGLSSALIVMASEYMSFYYDIDASRIPSQILAGIGFIGAGTIIRTGLNVRGVTTAAGILSVTCIGIAVGMGYYEAAVISTLVVFFILSVNHEITGKFERYETISLVISYKANSEKTLDEIKEFLKKDSVNIQSMSKEALVDKKTEVIKIAGTYDTKKFSKNDIISELVTLKSVTGVEEDINS